MRTRRAKRTPSATPPRSKRPSWRRSRSCWQNNRQPKAQCGQGDIAYNFTHGSKIERIYVSAAVRDHLTAGRLVIVVMNGVVELVPRVIADKIAERDAALVVRVNKASTAGRRGRSVCRLPDPR